MCRQMQPERARMWGSVDGAWTGSWGIAQRIGVEQLRGSLSSSR
jgi:hypothetical protein